MNFNDNEFTLMSKYQVENGIFNEIGYQCTVSDFAIMLGLVPYGAPGGISLKDRTGGWFLKDAYDNDNEDVLGIDIHGNFGHFPVYARAIGIRPVLPFDSTYDLNSIYNNLTVGKNGVYEVEYGEYPQYAADQNLQYTLEEKFQNGALRKTGKTYTTDSVAWFDSDDKSFIPQEHIEYEYNGKRYVRVMGKQLFDFKLSNGDVYWREKNVAWIEVSPIKWLVDEENRILISEILLAAGVTFKSAGPYGDSSFFHYTMMYNFLNNYFAKDIIPNTVKSVSISHNMNNNIISNNTNIIQPQNNNNIISKNSNSNVDTGTVNKPQDSNGKTQAPPKVLKKRKNPYGLNIGQVTEEQIIKGAIESGVAVFLHGPSSEGKSARVKQIDPDCVIIYLRNATTESLNGKSVYNSETGEMIDIKPSWLKKIEEKCEKEPDRLHIVFLDEITNALPSIQGIAFNIVLDKEVNGIWKLPENARIVAAGNDMKDSLAANQLAEPLFNRFAHVYIHTTTQSWLKWASEHNIHPAIYSYIAYKKGSTLRSEYNGEKPNADPRKWEMASKMLYATGQPEMLRSLVGEDITREFVQFCNQEVITLDDVINDNYTYEDVYSLNTAERYATTMGLTQVGEDNLDKVRGFMNLLGAEFCAIFDSLWIHGDEKRLEIIAEAKLAGIEEGGIRK